MIHCDNRKHRQPCASGILKFAHVLNLITLTRDIITLTRDIITLTRDIIALTLGIITLMRDIITLTRDLITLTRDVHALTTQSQVSFSPRWIVEKRRNSFIDMSDNV